MLLHTCITKLLLWARVCFSRLCSPLGQEPHLICYTICYLYCAQLGSVAQSCPTLCDPMDCSPPGLPVHHWLLELTQLRSTESVMPSNQLILCHLAHNMLSVSGWWGCFDARNAVFTCLVTPPSRDIDRLINPVNIYVLSTKYMLDVGKVSSCFVLLCLAEKSRPCRVL